MTTTVVALGARASQHLRSERDDLHELLGAQLASDRPEDAGADRLVVLVDQHGRVRVEPDVAAVLRATPLCVVRTMTAFATSPFFTLALGIASLIETTMMSPSEAYLRRVPPSTWMHMSFLAPELSATSRVVVV